MPFNPGQNVGPYRIIEQLGQGGMATVFKAYHAALDRYVALKVLHPAFKEEPNFLARFQREARIVANLDHPHIVPVYDFDEHEGMPYLVMRYIEGQTLKARLAEGSLSREQILRIIKLAGEALAYAHEQGVLHRDIKPSNIMLTPAGGVYLTDFGLARIAQSGESTLSRDVMVGTPQYISPEQAKGEELDARTDIYSLGVVIFELLTGQVPFSADTPYAVVHNHIYSPLPLPRKIAPDLSLDMERVILKALAKDKEDRYQTVTDLVAAFEKAMLASEPESEAKPLEPLEMEMETEVSPAAPVAEEPAAPPVEAALETTVELKGEEAVSPAISQAETVVDVPRSKSSRWAWLVGIGVAILLLCLCGSAVAMFRGRQKAQSMSATATSMAEATPPPPGTPRPEDRERLERARQAVEENPNDPQAHLDLARAYAQMGDLDEALEEYRQTVELDPTLIDAYIEAGDLLVVQGDWEEATLAYEMALEQDPDNVFALTRAGHLRAFQRDWGEATAHFRRAVELRPNAPVPHAGLGICLVASGELEAGRRELEEALRLAPDLPEAHFGLGLYHAATGDRLRAMKELRFVLQAQNVPPWLEKLTRGKIEELEGIEGRGR